MNDTIKCPHCGKTFPMDQALTHELKEKLQVEQKIKLEEEKKKLNNEARRWREEQLGKLQEKAKKEMELQIKDKGNENEELKKQNQSLQNQLLELTKSIRQLRTDNQNAKIELEKKLAFEQEKIRAEEKKRSDEEYRLKISEKEKQLHDAIRVNEELKRKLEQGSQQSQGEVMEDELKKILTSEFSYDEILDVPKGIRGADLIQKVKNNLGKECGTILWESKRTKAWTDGWITKLKEDQREIKAEIAIIISQVLPQGIKRFGIKDGIWVVDYETVLGAAISLRNSLIDLFGVRSANKGKEEKKEILWNYLNSTQFKQRIEAISDVYNQMQEEMEIEKRWFSKKWAKQEKNIRQVLDSVTAMDGDLRGIMGKPLPEPVEQPKLDSVIPSKEGIQTKNGSPSSRG